MTPGAPEPPRARIRVQVAPELRFLLPAVHRHGDVSFGHDGTSSLGHVVEALGVPLTEVGLLTVDGREVPPSHRPVDGEHAEVHPVHRPQHLPPEAPRPPRFLLDVHLGTLARRLRLVGVDAAYRNDSDDDALLRQANEEKRVLLTRDRGLLRRHALWAGAHVRGSSPDAQAADVLDRFAPALRPWSRCTACNGLLAPVRKADIADRLPPGTRRTYDTFRRCGTCGRLYWPGAHHARLRARVEAALADAARRRERANRGEPDGLGGA
ncbi:Mut7-C RNAse domain-containing protein [Streptomyces sp. TR06-5]|uniref:Mut7-C RNAse domain-containing protein n=1 Tax=unclassified Streptomyces TaxID=2593676 RepID=UPI0039A0D3E8